MAWVASTARGAAAGSSSATGSSSSNSGSSGTGVSAGEIEAGLIVLGVWLDLLTSSSIRFILASEGCVESPWNSWEGNRGCDRVMELLLGAAPPRSGLTFFSSSCNIALALWSSNTAASRSLFFCAKASVSCRLRSRDDWAARRFRRTRSTRRCSFSSSVLARFLGGRLVFGSGSTWPQDFLFLVGFLSPDSSGSGDGESKAPGDMEDAENRFDGSIVAGVDGSGEKRLGYDSEIDSCLTRGDGSGVDSMIVVCLYCVNGLPVRKRRPPKMFVGSGRVGCCSVSRLWDSLRPVPYCWLSDLVVYDEIVAVAMIQELAMWARFRVGWKMRTDKLHRFDDG